MSVLPITLLGQVGDTRGYHPRVNPALELMLKNISTSLGLEVTLLLVQPVVVEVKLEKPTMSRTLGMTYKE